jgi:hypothetical protein
MAGKGRVPKPPGARRNSGPLHLGDWRSAPGVGWQHGPRPKPPTGLGDVARATWATWFGAWWASYWEPADVPTLRLVIRLFDRVERGEATGVERSELRLWMDTYGITPKGRQDRRWLAPSDETQPPPPRPRPRGSYGHLRAIDSEGA